MEGVAQRGLLQARRRGGIVGLPASPEALLLALRECGQSQDVVDDRKQGRGRFDTGASSQHSASAPWQTVAPRGSQGGHAHRRPSPRGFCLKARGPSLSGRQGRGAPRSEGVSRGSRRRRVGEGGGDGRPRPQSRPKARDAGPWGGRGGLRWATGGGFVSVGRLLRPIPGGPPGLPTVHAAHRPTGPPPTPPSSVRSGSGHTAALGIASDLRAPPGVPGADDGWAAVVAATGVSSKRSTAAGPIHPNGEGAQMAFPQVTVYHAPG